MGFIGPTGSGKSTLLDIIMGLLFVKEKSLRIDNADLNHKNYRNWQVHIAHVPQNIYLSDASIAENIAFGVKKININMDRVKKVAKQSMLTELIEGWSDQYETCIGERGVRLSGGQRQRIGIARALYKGADTLVLDEATSSLDNGTERLIMQEIENLDKNITILIVAHRLSTLKSCDKVVEIKNGKLRIVGSYEEVVCE